MDALQVSRMLRAVPEGSGPREHIVLCAIVQAVSACFCSFEDRKMTGHFGADECSCVVCVSLRSPLCPTQLFSAGSRVPVKSNIRIGVLRFWLVSGPIMCLKGFGGFVGGRAVLERLTTIGGGGSPPPSSQYTQSHTPPLKHTVLVQVTWPRSSSVRKVIRVQDGSIRVPFLSCSMQTPWC